MELELELVTKINNFEHFSTKPRAHLIVQLLVYPRCHPSKYRAVLTLCNFADSKGAGVSWWCCRKQAKCRRPSRIYISSEYRSRSIKSWIPWTTRIVEATQVVMNHIHNKRKDERGRLLREKYLIFTGTVTDGQFPHWRDFKKQKYVSID